MAIAASFYLRHVDFSLLQAELNTELICTGRGSKKERENPLNITFDSNGPLTGPRHTVSS